MVRTTNVSRTEESAKRHYEEVVRDMLGTYGRRLADHEYVIGAYSIADIAGYPDVHIHGVNDIGLGDYLNVKRWHDTIEARPVFQRAWTPFARGWFRHPGILSAPCCTCAGPSG